MTTIVINGVLCNIMLQPKEGVVRQWRNNIAIKY